MIQIKGLNKYYHKGKENQIHVINDVSLTLPDTGFICILGESGSGKTTLMNAVSGIDDYKSGSIVLDDLTVNKASSKEFEAYRTSQFGHIFQNFYLLKERTVEYNIRICLEMYEISEEEIEKRIDYVLQAVDLRRYKKKLVSQLSGGQQQRVSIARALAKSPKVIFADEPTGNLDEANTMRTMSILKKISNDCLVVLVTHEKRLAGFFADRIIYVEDGKVIRDEVVGEKENYAYVDDNNLYLKEYNKVSYETEKVEVHTYSNEEMPKLTLNVVYERGRFYIQASDEANVAFLTANDTKKVIDDYKPELKMEDVERYDYRLEPLGKAVKPRLSLKEVLILAWRNTALLGKKQVFMVLSLFVMAVLSVFAVADMMTLNHIDIESIVHTDSHVLSIGMERNDYMSYDDVKTAFGSLYDQLKASGQDLDVYIDIERPLKFTYQGFSQITDLTGTMEQFSYVPINYLKEKDLICGRMPEFMNEIVVDRWVLQDFLERNGLIKSVMQTPEAFLNNYMTVDKKGYWVKIVGISDSGEPDVYVDPFFGMCISAYSEPIMSLSQLKDTSDGEYDDVVLKKGQALVAVANPDEKYADTFTMSCGLKYQIVGSYPAKYGAQIVVPDEDYDDLLKAMAIYGKKIMVYSRDKAGLKDWIETGLSDDVKSKIRVKVLDRYEESYRKYERARQIKVDARLIVTISIAFVSMVILYFTMKASALKKIHDISVYRLLGIAKSSLYLMFVMENLYVSLYTTLPGVVLTVVVMKFLSSIPSFGIGIIYPWPMLIANVLVLTLADIIIGLLPIRKILKYPPAQIASKYDI